MNLADSKESLPKGWQIMKLATTAINSTDGFTDGDWIETPYIADEGIRLIQTGNIGLGRFLDNPESRKFVSMQTFQQLDCKWTYPGDILICRLADPVGRSCLVPEKVGPSITAVDCTIYRPNSKVVDGNYMVQLLNSERYLQRAVLLSAGTTRQRISRTNLGMIEILIPPHPEQLRIAEILDTVDRTITQTERMIEKLKSIKSGLLHDLLTKGIGDKSNRRETPIGLLRENVSLARIQTYFDVDYGLGQPPSLDTNGPPLIRATNIKNGEIVSEDLMYARKALLPEKAIFLKEGDIIVVRSGAYTGDVAIIRQEWAGAVAGYDLVLTMKPKSHNIVDPVFLFHFLISPINQYCHFKVLRSRTAQPHLNAQEVGRTLFPLFEYDEQKRIAEALESIRLLIIAEANYLRKLIRIKSGLMSDLLTGRVRVKFTKEEQELE